jgi:hypothetical protein
MARTRTFSDYRRGLESSREAWLGELVWFTVPDATRISHDDLLVALKECALEDFAPPRPQDDDVFRRVCTAHQRKKVETPDPDVFENYLIRDVKRSGGKCTKQIVVEQVNGANKRLSYAPAVQLEHDKSTGQVIIEELDTAEDSTQALNLAELIVQNYKHDRGTLNSMGIRWLLRTVLERSDATIVRPSGGIYFVSIMWADRVASLEKLGEKIGITVHPCPLLDDKKQRAMLRAAFKAETVDEIDKMLGEIDTMLKGDEVPERKYLDMYNRMQAITARTGEYAELLEEEFGNAEFRMDILQKKTKQLLNHVKVT